MNAKPSLENRKEQPYAAIRTAMSIPFGPTLQPLWDEVKGWLKSQGINSPGPAIIRYFTTDMSRKLDIDVGFVVEKPVSGNGRIITDFLPSGRYAILLYTGSYQGDSIYKTNAALMDWAKEKGIVWNTSSKNGVEWWNGRVEWYLTDPMQETDTMKYQTEVAILIK
jgi:effector-binding domain-containing protein